MKILEDGTIDATAPCRECSGPSKGLRCLNPDSPCHTYYCGMYPGTGEKYRGKEKDKK